MSVRRIVPDLHAEDPAAARMFYADVLGLEVAMDLGWIVTYAVPGSPAVPLSVMTNKPELWEDIVDVEHAWIVAPSTPHGNCWGVDASQGLTQAIGPE